MQNPTQRQRRGPPDIARCVLAARCAGHLPRIGVQRKGRSAVGEFALWGRATVHAYLLRLPRRRNRQTNIAEPVGTIWVTAGRLKGEDIRSLRFPRMTKIRLRRASSAARYARL